MLLELHAIQNFAPSNLNRDDTGAPKECFFGGYRRARISSQCWKRAMRLSFKEGGLLDGAMTGTRTKRIVEALTKRLAERGIADAEGEPPVVTPLVVAALGGLGLKLEDGKTQYLLFLSEQELDALADFCATHREALVGKPAESGDAPAKGKASRNEKSAAKAAITGEVKRALEETMRVGRAADVALFGRMIADNASINTDAASQVAHPLSTHEVSVEFDYYTAVDDLNPKDETGAGMIGNVEFNSACFYRYANVNLDQLHANLKRDAAMTERATEAFIRAFVHAVPSGKQNSMAAQNPPSLVFAVVREAGNWSLANAFAAPVLPGRERDIVGNSVAALDRYWSNLVAMYGEEQIADTCCIALDDTGLAMLKDNREPGVDALVRRVLGAALAPKVSA